jgi:hypothetical protein
MSRMIRDGGRGFNSLSNLINFLADPKASQAVVEAHKKATDKHNEAAERHQVIKDQAQAQIDELEQKKAEHDAREKRLVEWNDHLAKVEREQAVIKHNFEEWVEEIEKDRSHVEAKYENAQRESDLIISSAKEEARKVNEQQRVIVDRITTEALKKDSEAEAKRTEVNKLAYLVEGREKALADREALVSKREQSLREVAKSLGG